jgi:DNA-binding XRE family transcriptional regulator
VTKRVVETLPSPIRNQYGGPMATSAEEILEQLTSVRLAASDASARLVRIMAGASLAEIGRAIGSTKGTISKWERGLAVPRGEPAVRYGAVLATLAAIAANGKQ